MTTQFNTGLINVHLQVSDSWRNFAQAAGVSSAAPKTLLLKWWVYTDEEVGKLARVKTFIIRAEIKELGYLRCL